MIDTILPGARLWGPRPSESFFRGCSGLDITFVCAVSSLHLNKTPWIQVSTTVSLRIDGDCSTVTGIIQGTYVSSAAADGAAY